MKKRIPKKLVPHPAIVNPEVEVCRMPEEDAALCNEIIATLKSGNSSRADILKAAHLTDLFVSRLAARTSMSSKRARSV